MQVASEKGGHISGGSSMLKWCFFSCQSFMGVSTSEELEHAIESCKELIKAAPENSEEGIRLVDKLVQLRFKLQEAQVRSGVLVLCVPSSI